MGSEVSSGLMWRWKEKMFLLTPFGRIKLMVQVWTLTFLTFCCKTAHVLHSRVNQWPSRGDEDLLTPQYTGHLEPRSELTSDDTFSWPGAAPPL